MSNEHFASADPEQHRDDRHAQDFGERPSELAMRVMRTMPREYLTLAPVKRASSYCSPPNDFTRRIPLTLSCSTLVISP